MCVCVCVVTVSVCESVSVCCIYISNSLRDAVSGIFVVVFVVDSCG